MICVIRSWITNDSVNHVHVLVHSGIFHSGRSNLRARLSDWRPQEHECVTTMSRNLPKRPSGLNSLCVSTGKKGPKGAAGDPGNGLPGPDGPQGFRGVSLGSFTWWYYLYYVIWPPGSRCCRCVLMTAEKTIRLLITFRSLFWSKIRRSAVLPTVSSQAHRCFCPSLKSVTIATAHHVSSCLFNIQTYRISSALWWRVVFHSFNQVCSEVFTKQGTCNATGPQR